MKILTTLMVLISIPALAGDHMVCSYQKGQIISLRTGLRVARTFQPKVMEVLRIEGNIEGNKIALHSLMDNFHSAIGQSGCMGSEREGMNCFSLRMIRPQMMNFTMYQANKQMVLVKSLPVPGGAIQEDEYLCQF
ncbi:MAG: hypothetical protein V4598_09200 [Bdellovibrionota bacterium]